MKYELIIKEYKLLDGLYSEVIGWHTRSSLFFIFPSLATGEGDQRKDGKFPYFKPFLYSYRVFQGNCQKLKDCTQYTKHSIVLFWLVYFTEASHFEYKTINN